MTIFRHSASAGSAAVGGMRSMAACRRFRTSALAGWLRASSKEPKGTVTDAGSAIESGSLPRRPAGCAQGYGVTLKNALLSKVPQQLASETRFSQLSYSLCWAR